MTCAEKVAVMFAACVTSLLLSCAVDAAAAEHRIPESVLHRDYGYASCIPALKPCTREHSARIKSYGAHLTKGDDLADRNLDAASAEWKRALAIANGP